MKHIINKIIKRFDSSAANTRQAFARRGEWQLKIFRFHISLANPTGRGNEKKKMRNKRRWGASPTCGAGGSFMPTE